MFRANTAEAIDNLIALLSVVWQHVKAGQPPSVTFWILASIFAAQKTARQRTPDEHTDTGVLHERHQLMLQIAADKRVVQLGSLEPGPSVFSLEANSLRRSPSRPIGKSRVSDFA